MGNTLNNTAPGSNWPALIKIGDNNGATSTLKQLSDGYGNDLPIQVSTSEVALTADTTVNGVRVGMGAGNVASNTAVGSSALNANTTGANNVALGIDSLSLNTTGIQNTAIGSGSIQRNVSGSNNVGLGYQTLGFLTGGSQNMAIGFRALLNSNGSSNVAIGYASLLNTTSSNNTAIGTEAGFSNTSGTGLTAIGYQALRASTGSNNTALGFQAGLAVTTGFNNTTLGFQAGLALSTGSSNVFIGNTAGNTVTTGLLNVFIGHDSQTKNAVFNLCTAIGSGSRGADSGVAIGANANTGVSGVTIGYASIGNTSSTVIGTQATSSTFTSCIVLGREATANGNNSVVIGQLAVGAGADSVVIGKAHASGLGITTGSKNTIIGANITGLSASLSNNIILADGDGNIRVQVDNTGATSLRGNALTNFVPTINGGGALTITSANQDQYCGTVYQVSGAVNITIDASVRNGFSLSVIQVDANQCTFVAGSGLTLSNRSSHTKSAGQWATCTLIKNVSQLILSGDTA